MPKKKRSKSEHDLEFLARTQFEAVPAPPGADECLEERFKWALWLARIALRILAKDDAQCLDMAKDLAADGAFGAQKELVESFFEYEKFHQAMAEALRVAAARSVCSIARAALEPEVAP